MPSQGKSAYVLCTGIVCAFENQRLQWHSVEGVFWLGVVVDPLPIKVWSAMPVGFVIEDSDELINGGHVVLDDVIPKFVEVVIGAGSVIQHCPQR